MAKKQQVVRKKNKRMEPIVPQFVEAGDPVVLCPSCHAPFRLSEAGPHAPCAAPPVTCPHCDALCDAEAYDREAACVIGIQRDVERLRAERDEALRAFGEKPIWRIPLLGRLLSRARGAYRQRLEESYGNRLLEATGAMVSLDALASSRYLTSEYHLMTRTPLKFYAKRNGYCIKCRYDAEGSFGYEPLHGYGACRGLIGEVSAFEAVSAAMRSSEGLAGAHLVPNVFVRKNDDSNPYERGSYFSQIDMVLLTRRAAYVFEVKSRHAEVRRDERGALRATYTGGEAPRTKNLAGDLQQLADPAFHFHRCAGRYPFDAVFEVMLYVDPIRFDVDDGEFHDNLLVASVEQGTMRAFGVIERQDRLLDDVMDQGRLDHLAREVLERYGDRDLRKRQMHAMRLDRKTA